MRFSIIVLFSLFALVYAQELLVEEEESATSMDGVVIEEELDLDELLKAENDIMAATEEAAAETSDEIATDSIEEIEEVTTEEEVAASSQDETAQEKPIEQSGPFVDLLGHQLYSLEIIDETQAQLVPQYTNEALKGKKVVGLYFSGTKTHS